MSHDPRSKIIGVLNRVAFDYTLKGNARAECHDEHDVHLYLYVTRAPEKVVHVQVYPGLSTEHEMQVWARLMNYHRLQETRRKLNISIGNEHKAAIRTFENFGGNLGTRIPYEADILRKMLEHNVEELR